ncbi:MAG: hypothetical protein V7K90_03675 [Nostoc sp.]
MNTLVSLSVPLPYGTLRERGSKLRAASRREVLSDIGLKPWRVPISHEE